MVHPPAASSRRVGKPPVTHIGVLDWGIGGLDLHERLQTACPGLAFTYLSDSGFAPYGTVPADALRSRIQRLAAFLQGRGADALVVACNAASTVLPLSATHLCTTGVIEPTLATLSELGTRDVAVLGGKRTIESGAYERPLREGGVTVRAVVAQPLSALVEAGQLSGPELSRALAPICDGLQGVETLVPACTHYVALLPALRAAIRPARVVDPATCTLDHILQTWSLQPRDSVSAARQVFTTGSAANMRSSARLAFGIELGAVRGVELLSLERSRS